MVTRYGDIIIINFNTIAMMRHDMSHNITLIFNITMGGQLGLLGTTLGSI